MLAYFTRKKKQNCSGICIYAFTKTLPWTAWGAPDPQLQSCLALPKTDALILFLYYPLQTYYLLSISAAKIILDLLFMLFSYLVFKSMILFLRIVILSFQMNDETQAIMSKIITVVMLAFCLRKALISRLKNVVS